LTLKTICLLKVTRLNLTYDDIPLDLQKELTKIKKFSGHFVGSRCFNFDDAENDEKKSAMTVQYMGDRKWKFHLSHTWDTCSDENCSVFTGTVPWKRNDCRKSKQGVVELLLEEDKELKSGLLVWKALSRFGPSLKVEQEMRYFYKEDSASTVLTVEDEEESDQGSSFCFTSKLPGKRLKCEYVYCNHFRLDHTGGIRSLSMTCPISGTPNFLQLLQSEGPTVASASDPDEESGTCCDFWVQ